MFFLPTIRTTVLTLITVTGKNNSLLGTGTRLLLKSSKDRSGLGAGVQWGETHKHSCVFASSNLVEEEHK